MQPEATCAPTAQTGGEVLGRATPPPYTLIPFRHFEAAAADLEDSLKIGGREYDS